MPIAKRSKGFVTALAGFGLSWRQNAALVATTLAIILLPILILADRGPDVTVPLHLDFAAIARLLAALPLLMLAAPWFEQLMEEALEHAPRAQLVPAAAVGRYQGWVSRLRDLRTHPVAEIVIVALAIGSTILHPPLPGPLAGLKGWGFAVSGELNAAGFWYCHVAMALLRTVLLLWAWRLLLWTIFLGSLPFLHLDLNPAHPDGTAGIGYVGFVQQRLAVVLAANGFILSGIIANRVWWRGEEIERHFHALASYVILYPLILLLPLVLTVPLLLRTKQRGIFAFGGIGQQLARAFHDRWIAGAPVEEPLESPNPSAVADFGAVYGSVQNMRIFPMGGWNILAIFVSAMAPLTLLIFLYVPPESLLRSALAELPPIDLVYAVTEDHPAPKAPPHGEAGAMREAEAPAN